MEVLIPNNDPVRLLSAFVEELELTDLYRSYGKIKKGQASPRQMFKIIIYAAMNRIYSSRDIETACRRDINFMYLLEGKPAPDHATIARFISLHLSQCSKKSLAEVTMLLKDLGEISGIHLFIDGTKIESAANRYTFVWKKAVTKHQKRLCQKIAVLVEELEILYGLRFIFNGKRFGMGTLKKIRRKLYAIKKEEGIEFVHGPGKKKTQIQRSIELLEKYLKKLKDYNQKLYKCGTRNSYSKTDEDATFMRMKEDHMLNGQLKPAYNIQNAVDSNYIVASSISADRTDLKTAGHILRKLDLLPWKYDIYCADSGYDSLESFWELDKRGIEAYIKPQDWEISKTRSYRSDIGRSANMTYVEKDDCFICRNGRKLTFSGLRTNRKYLRPARVYECHWGCISCPYRHLCIRNHRKIRYKRFEVQLEHQQYQKTAFEKLSSEFGAEVRANRSIQVEGRFAFQKQQFGLRRFSSFGKTRVFSEWLICCMAVNTVQLAARIEQNKVGTPFWYRIKAGPAEETA